MSSTGHTVQQQQQLQYLKQELQNELTTTNQLLWSISIELQKIKDLTQSGGEYETNIVETVSLIEKLANMQNIDLKHLPSIERNLNNETNENM